MVAPPIRLVRTPTTADPFVLPGFSSLKTVLCGTARLTFPSVAPGGIPFEVVQAPRNLARWTVVLGKVSGE